MIKSTEIQCENQRPYPLGHGGRQSIVLTMNDCFDDGDIFVNKCHVTLCHFNVETIFFTNGFYQTIKFGYRPIRKEEMKIVGR